MAVPPPASMGFGFFDYDQLRRSWYVFFFQTPLAEFAVAMDDHAFIDRLWADWSPGYDGAWDAARVKEALGDRGRLSAAIGYYRAMLGPPSDDPAAAAAQAAGEATGPQPTLYLHGAADGCMGLEIIGRSPTTSPRARSWSWSRARATSSTSSGPTRSTATSCGSSAA